MLRLVVFSCLILAAPVVQAEEFVSGKFCLAGDKLLRLQFQGRPLIERDALDYSPGFEQAGQLLVGQHDGKQVLNVVQPQGNPVSYRKEVAIGPEGVELTVKYKLPAYANDLERPSIRYVFYVPLAALEGTKWKACVGRGRSLKVVEGKTGSSLSGIRYIAFKGKDLQLVIDFNPQGITAGGDYASYGEPVGCWAMQREGDCLAFSFGYRASFYGGVFMSKCLIYEGPYEYEARHAWRDWGYRGPTLPVKLFTFGTENPPKLATKADLQPYTAETGFGWRQSEVLRLRQTNPSGIVNNDVGASSGQAAEFLVDLVPGRWLATVRIAAIETPVGPMSLSVGGHVAAGEVSVAAGEVRSVTVLADHSAGRPLAIAFSGPGAWTVSSIALQPLLYVGEDFTFARGLWNIGGVFTPQ